MKLLIFALCLALTEGFARTQNPTASSLQHGSFALEGSLSRNLAYSDSTWEARYPFVSSLSFGLFGNVEMGVAYGDGLSVFGQAQLFQGEEFIPAFAFGVRSLFDSPEAHVYNYVSSTPWEGEAYALAEKEFWDGGIWHVGASLFSGADEVDLFWGWQESMKANLFFSYEGFQRQNKVHHNLGLGWEPSPQFKLEGGLLEAKKWFYQNSEFGFFTESEDPQSSSLNTPGLYLQFTLSGKMKTTENTSVAGRLQALEKRQMVLHDSLGLVQSQLKRAVVALEKITGPSVEIRQKEEAIVTELFEKIVDEIQKGEFDPATIHLLQDSLVKQGDPAKRYLQRLVEHPATSMVYKENAIRLMGYSKFRVFTSDLILMLRHEAALIRREALIALSHIGDLAAREEIRKLIKDPDPIVAEIAVFVDKNLTKKHSMVK